MTLPIALSFSLRPSSNESSDIRKPCRRTIHDFAQDGVIAMFWRRKKSEPKIGGDIAQFGLEDWWMKEFSEDERVFIRSKVGDIDHGSSNPSFGIGGRQRTVTKFLTEVAAYFSRKDQVHIGLRILEEARRPQMHPVDEHFHWMQYIEQRYKLRNEDDQAIPDVVAASERMIDIAPAVVREFKREYGSADNAVPPSHPGFERLIIIRKKQKNMSEVERLEQQFHEVWGKHTK